MSVTVDSVLEDIRKTNQNETVFLQAVEEVAKSLQPLFNKRPELLPVFRVIAEPERVLQFRVVWYDDAGKMHVNRAWRVQYNQAIGPFKGGLRFRQGLEVSVLKFLGFEQCFKNALTTLPMGGAKGGSDFEPKGKSDAEVMRFCQAFMRELFHHIGHHTDVPAGDMGVGGREIGFLFGEYKRLTRSHVGTLTGKGSTWGGSLIRPEATGYGAVYITQRAHKSLLSTTLEGKRVLLSGSGNVSQFAAEKLIQLGAKVLTMSDSTGCVYEESGFTAEQLQHIMDLKNKRRGRISEYTKFSSTAVYVEGGNPWAYKADAALPCATQNEIDTADAQNLVNAGVKILVEGANMPTTNSAIDVIKAAKIIYIPGKASNAGGVAVSGLEMTQNYEGLYWTREEVDTKLQSIMNNIFDTISTTAEEMGVPGDFQVGANVAGFLKVATAMIEQGYVSV